MAIVTLVLWFLTAAAGITLLRAGGIAAQADAEEQVAEVPSAAAAAVASTMGAATAGASTAGTASTVGAASTASASTPTAGAAARPSAVPLAPGGLPPPVPHARVTTRPGQHPLLEFAHPALGVTGVACWFMFTFVHYRPLAWISFCILLVTIGVGLGWLGRNRTEVSNHVNGASRFPPRLIALHGGFAALSIALTVLTALIASHG